MALPDFLVIGAPKAGTTALHAALGRHPSLYMSAIKEPKFFLTDGPPPARGGPGDAKTYREHVWRRADYEALFDPAPAGALRGESTPFYLCDREAQWRIRALIPHAKLIAVLRDPVERAHSNWTHLWSAGLEPIGDVVQACAAESDRIADGWATFWHYTRLGRYGEQLEHLYTVSRASRFSSSVTVTSWIVRPTRWTVSAGSWGLIGASSAKSPERTSRFIRSRHRPAEPDLERCASALPWGGSFQVRRKPR